MRDDTNELSGCFWSGLSRVMSLANCASVPAPVRELCIVYDLEFTGILCKVYDVQYTYTLYRHSIHSIQIVYAGIEYRYSICSTYGYGPYGCSIRIQNMQIQYAYTIYRYSFQTCRNHTVCGIFHMLYMVYDKWQTHYQI